MPNQHTGYPPVADLFWAKVNKDGSIPNHALGLGACWVWTAAIRGPDGRGQFKFCRRTRPASVVAYILTTGHEPPPETPYVTHLCDNPPCVNPSHLLADTNAGNTAQKIERGRMPRGEQRSFAKLTADKVRDARARYVAGETSIVTLAAENNVSRRTMGQAIAGRKKWKHVL